VQIKHKQVDFERNPCGNDSLSRRNVALLKKSVATHMQIIW